MSAYDKKGKFWKQWVSCWKYDQKSNYQLFVGAFAMDVQKEHGTTIPIKYRVNIGTKPENMTASAYLMKK
jgi:hypothetical protein